MTAQDLQGPEGQKSAGLECPYWRYSGPPLSLLHTFFFCSVHHTSPQSTYTCPGYLIKRTIQHDQQPKGAAKLTREEDNVTPRDFSGEDPIYKNKPSSSIFRGALKLPVLPKILTFLRGQFLANLGKGASDGLPSQSLPSFISEISPFFNIGQTWDIISPCTHFVPWHYQVTLPIGLP